GPLSALLRRLGECCLADGVGSACLGQLGGALALGLRCPVAFVLCALAFLEGPSACLLSQDHASGRRRNADQKHDDDRADAVNEGTVSARELAKLLPSARWSGQDWPILQIAVEIFGERQGGVVSLPRIFLQALQADRFQVARQPRLQP